MNEGHEENITLTVGPMAFRAYVFSLHNREKDCGTRKLEDWYL
jgi:hypothetical protein